MNSINKTEVCRIKVAPLAYWKNQRERQKPILQKWPASSDAICWYCCHAFDTVPVFLPVECDVKRGIFIFTGNFCSWNCCKQYAMEMKNQPPGVVFIGFLSYLTCHRGLFCSSDAHELGLCDCMLEYRGVTRPCKKEQLQSFGGTMTIQEFRQDFIMIRTYEWVEKFFSTNESLLLEYRNVLKLRTKDQQNIWGFEYISYPPSPDYVVEYVNILPLSGKVMRDESRMTVLVGNETGSTFQHTQEEKTKIPSRKSTTTRKRQCKSNSKVIETEEQVEEENDDKRKVFCGVTQSKPGNLRPNARSTIRKNPLALPNDTMNSTKCAGERVMTTEQVLLVNEEQAFYTQNLRKYGNLMDSMGISISRPDE